MTETLNRTVRKVLIEEVLGNFPRVLAFLDRNPVDNLCGSFDREYWAWNFKDYPNMSLQSGVYLLSLMWDLEFEGNVYRGDRSLLDYAKKALLFWVKNQKRNGSFDQCYYNEQSYGTTSYTLIAVLKALPFIERHLSESERDRVSAAIKRASRFLLKNSEKYSFIANHQAQFMYAFLLLSDSLEEDGYRDKHERSLGSLESVQSEEGWFEEYGGVDIGYLSQTIYYLALCHEHSPDRRLHEMIEKATRFFSHFVHPDGSVGGVYGSRYNTNFYPAGFALSSGSMPLAGAILVCCTESANKKMRLASLDPENTIRLMTNYVETIRCLGPENKGHLIEETLPCDVGEMSKHFEDAGIYVRGNERYYLVVSAMKGGSMVVYDKRSRKLLFADPGYVLQLSDGTKATNGIIQDAECRISEDRLVVKVGINTVRIPVYSPFKGFVLRLLSFTLFRWVRLNECFKKMLVKYLVVPTNKMVGSLTREIVFGKERVEVNDELHIKGGLRIEEILEDSQMRACKMASTGYHFESVRDTVTEKRVSDNHAAITRCIEEDRENV